MGKHKKKKEKKEKQKHKSRHVQSLKPQLEKSILHNQDHQQFLKGNILGSPAFNNEDGPNMVANMLFRYMVCLFLLLSLLLLLESLKTCPRDTYTATSLLMNLNLDVNQFPWGRISPCWKRVQYG